MYESTVGAAKGSSSAALALTGGNSAGASLDYGPADQERERSYALAENLQGQLDSLASSLASMIGTVNSLTAANGGSSSTAVASAAAGEGANETSPPVEEDPIGQISQILDAHLKSLQWIDGASDGLRTRVGEVERRLVDVSGGGGVAAGAGAGGALAGGASRLGASQTGGVGGGGRFGLSRRN